MNRRKQYGWAVQYDEQVGPLRKVPTLYEFAHTLVQFNRAAGSFVREAQGDKSVAVAVVMLTPEARQRVGSVAQAHAVGLRQMPGHVAVFVPETPLPEYFRELERLGAEWFSGWAGSVSIFCFMGACVTEELCEALTAAGCPTRVT